MHQREGHGVKNARWRTNRTETGPLAYRRVVAEQYVRTRANVTWRREVRRQGAGRGANRTRAVRPGCLLLQCRDVRGAWRLAPAGILIVVVLSRIFRRPPQRSSLVACCSRAVASARREDRFAGHRYYSLSRCSYVKFSTSFNSYFLNMARTRSTARRGAQCVLPVKTVLASRVTKSATVLGAGMSLVVSSKRG